VIWWLLQPVRAQAERAAIGDLAGRVPWLANVIWRIGDELKLVAEFDLLVGDSIIPLTLLYPDYFPDGAPSVLPRNGIRLSSHQYGAAGELCLEYRPDNWSPDITGAMMVESAHRLLSTEIETAEPAPSAHRTSPAQQMRGESFRFVLTQDAMDGLAGVGAGDAVEAEAEEHVFAGCFVAQLTRIGTAGASNWIEPDRRGGIVGLIQAWIVRLPAGTAGPVGGVHELLTFLEAHAFRTVATEMRSGGPGKFTILIDQGIVRPMLVYGAAEALRLVEYKTAVAEPSKPRLDPEYAPLSACKVAIVGCGSVGSKVAMHLVRAGVRKFVLVDGDVLASGNLVRNELDWRAVGLHKSSALAARLKEIRAGCDVTTYCIVMGGQESGAIIAGAMRSIEDCDVIIEATADARAFNLCAAISRRSRKPMCWGQVFGGGIGGIVVRLRPGMDPTPLTARQRIEAWYASLGVPWPDDGSSNAYAITENGLPLIADDAEVSVIAAHLARMAVDLAARPGASVFPYSAYVVGMRDSWIFSAPFDTRPIDLGGSDTWGEVPESGADDARQQLIADLLPKSTDDET